jgi:hypothetical protein
MCYCCTISCCWQLFLWLLWGGGGRTVLSTLSSTNKQVHAIKLGSAKTCCQRDNVSSLASNDCCSYLETICGSSHIWYQNLGANVDVLQKSDVVHNKYSNWKESIFSVKKCNKRHTKVNTLLDREIENQTIFLAPNIFNFIISVQGKCGTLVEYQRLIPEVIGSSPGMICLESILLCPAASD